VSMIFSVASEEEAVAVANDTSFGLGSYVFTTDPEQAVRVADAIDAGMVFINGVLLDGAELPFGPIQEDAVDEDHASVDRISDPNRLLGVGGEHVRAQPERRVVRHSDRFL